MKFSTLALSAFFCLCPFGAAFAQTPPAASAAPSVKAVKKSTIQETTAALQTKVTLLSGETTLPLLLKEISNQTGIEVTAADYLAERRVTLTLEKTSAEAALDALAELNDWLWTVPEPGKVLVERRIAKVPVQKSLLILRIVSALPRDLRDYLQTPRGLDITDRAKYAAWAHQVMSDETLEEQFDLRKTALLKETDRQFSLSFEYNPNRETRYLYRKWTEAQKALFLRRRLLMAVDEIQPMLSLRSIPLYLASPEQAYLTLEGGALLGNSQEKVGDGTRTQSFAARFGEEERNQQ